MGEGASLMPRVLFVARVFQVLMLLFQIPGPFACIIIGDHALCGDEQEWRRRASLESVNKILKVV